MITPAQIHEFAPRCDDVAVSRGVQSAAERFDIRTSDRLSHWLAQCAHESNGFTRTVENLNYSAQRLCQVWPGRFPNIAAAMPYARNPDALAERVYGGRTDLGNKEPGDGAKFIGRGYIQLTGRANYTAAGEQLGLPWADEPELVATPSGAALSAGWFWDRRHLNDLADRDDLEAITRAINGGLNGLAERRVWLNRARAIWA